MKKFLILVAAGVCAVAAMTSVSAKDVAEQMRTVEPFTKVTLKGSMDVNITIADEQTVKVTADSNVIDRLSTRVEGGELIIDLDGISVFSRIHVMKVDITVPHLEGTSLRGSGDMNVAGVKGSDFELELKGSGDMVLAGFDLSAMEMDLKGSGNINLADAAVETLEIDLDGSGDVDMAGSCEHIKIKLNGSGDISGKDMTCRNADAKLRGSGDIRLFADKSANLSIKGSGDIDVYGKPADLHSNIQGSGDVTSR